MNAARVPAAQLDLTDGPSEDEADHLRTYRELLFTDNEQEVNMGALQDRLVPRIDPVTGQPVLDPVTGLPLLDPVPVAPAMSGAGANASPQFMGRFGAGGSHAGRLTADELRLISEWLDVGAQYYNNPFDAPIN